MDGERVMGRSPRGRRSRTMSARGPLEPGSISAWAEEPIYVRHFPICPRVDLRVGGGAGARGGALEVVGGRSPRGRRSLYPLVLNDARSGSISAWAEEPAPAWTAAASDRVDCGAWAEEPSCRALAASSERVDLRVGGGACLAVGLRDENRGRSPRGRRSQSNWCGGCPSCGSISAAGGGATAFQLTLILFEGRSPRGRRSRAV